MINSTFREQVSILTIFELLNANIVMANKRLIHTCFKLDYNFVQSSREILID